MKTDALVTLLSTQLEPTPRTQAHRWAMALGGGGMVALALMLGVFGLRHDLALARAEGMFWFKLAFALSLAMASWLATARLGRPGASLGRVVYGLLAPVVCLGLLAIGTWVLAASHERPALLFGTTWKTCAFNIALIASPLWLACMWLMRGLAPTRLHLAGAAAGLLAGALGCFLYAWHCPETAAPFVAIWYTLGVALPTSLGALMGPKMLRW